MVDGKYLTLFDINQLPMGGLFMVVIKHLVYMVNKLSACTVLSLLFNIPSPQHKSFYWCL
jgi:hypothetical protein